MWGLYQSCGKSVPRAIDREWRLSVACFCVANTGRGKEGREHKEPPHGHKRRHKGPAGSVCVLLFAGGTFDFFKHMAYSLHGFEFVCSYLPLLMFFVPSLLPSLIHPFSPPYRQSLQSRKGHPGDNFASQR